MALPIQQNSLRSFTDWAQSVKSGSVEAGLGAQPGAQVASLKDVTSIWARLTRAASVSTSRQAAIDGFRRALTECYGAAIANVAFRSAGGADGRGLTADIIKSATQNAARMANVRQVLTQAGMGVGVVNLAQAQGPEDVQAAVNGVGTASADLQGKTLLAFAQANALLGQTPLTKAEWNVFEANVRAANDALASCREGYAEVTGDEARQTVGVLREKMWQLAAHFSNCAQYRADLPGGTTAMTRYVSHWKAALAAACDKLMLDAGGSVDERTRLAAELDALTSMDDGAFRALFKTRVFFVTKKNKHIHKTLQDLLEKAVVRAYGGKDNVSVRGGLGKRVRDAHLKLLNEAEWRPLNLVAQGSLDGQSFKMRSQIVSGRHIDASLGTGYDPGVTAYNCHCTGTVHAVNLATSKLLVTGADGQEKVAFSGVRHGVHSAWDVDDADRPDANLNRAKESVTAAFKTYLEEHAQKVADWQTQHPNEPFPLPMTSVSLVTPDGFRASGLGKMVMHSSTSEAQMMRDQKQAWDALNAGDPLSVTVNGRAYQVKPNVIMFNYGVNMFATNAFSGINALGGWDNAEAINRPSLGALMQRVETFLANPPRGANVGAVRKLTQQIRAIASTQAERTAHNDAYKMPARLAVLTYLMGGVPCWNCKSGKDRTGQMDAECKFLATLISQGKDIPEPGAELTVEQKQLMRTIVLHAGNHEIQEYNTGMAGYKTHDVDANRVRMGADDEGFKAYKAGSGYVGS